VWRPSVNGEPPSVPREVSPGSNGFGIESRLATAKQLRALRGVSRLFFEGV
jgi:hypothetical protein